MKTKFLFPILITLSLVFIKPPILQANSCTCTQAHTGGVWFVNQNSCTNPSTATCDSSGGCTCSSPTPTRTSSPRGTCEDGEINTALGCFSTNINGKFFINLIRITVGLGGGIALLLILVGTLIITTSAGIPDRIKVGQSIITSAITGLIFIILSFFIMNLIGVRIIQLPGL